LCRHHCESHRRRYREGGSRGEPSTSDCDDTQRDTKGCSCNINESNLYVRLPKLLASVLRVDEAIKAQYLVSTQ
jgi:hypothetical protein